MRRVEHRHLIEDYNPSDTVTMDRPTTRRLSNPWHRVSRWSITALLTGRRWYRLRLNAEINKGCYEYANDAELARIHLRETFEEKPKPRFSGGRVGGMGG